jgi:hypothetical protein
MNYNNLIYYDKNFWLRYIGMTISAINFANFRLFHFFDENPYPDIDGQLLYMSQDEAIKAKSCADCPPPRMQKRTCAHSRELLRARQLLNLPLLRRPIRWDKPASACKRTTCGRLGGSHALGQG